MAKRQQEEADVEVVETPSKRLRRATAKKAYVEPSDSESEDPVADDNTTPTKGKRSGRSGGSSTPKVNGKTLFNTPGKTNGVTLSKAKLADQSAKRKSARALAENENEDDWAGDNALASRIIAATETTAQPSVEGGGIPAATPSKRGRGRPPGAKNKRSPTPEGDIAPEERYFFQNRMGPLKISHNAFSKVKPLSHEEYFESVRHAGESHKQEKDFLTRLHTRAFPQWRFELSQGFSICMYGYGSKLQLSQKFIRWIYDRASPRPHMIVVNGYAPKMNMRIILNTIASAIVGHGKDMKLTGQPQEMVEPLLARLDLLPVTETVCLVVNSIDSTSLRKASSQMVLARLASHARVQLIATADTPTFSLLWNSALLENFNFAFHDCTTFAPYKAELNVIDDVNELLGRKGRRAGGQEGIRYVLQSLPPNAQKLYNILVAEVLSVLVGEGDGDEEELDSRMNKDLAEETGVEYRILYDKACDAFICTSEMNFRFLLKEFHDHQMITSKRDAAGTELLCIPLAKEEMQGLLQDLGSLD
jgi:origin recognition complex subunit 2